MSKCLQPLKCTRTNSFTRKRTLGIVGGPRLDEVLNGPKSLWSVQNSHLENGWGKGYPSSRGTPPLPALPPNVHWVGRGPKQEEGGSLRVRQDQQLGPKPAENAIVWVAFSTSCPQIPTSPHMHSQSQASSSNSSIPVIRSHCTPRGQQRGRAKEKTEHRTWRSLEEEVSGSECRSGYSSLSQPLLLSLSAACHCHQRIWGSLAKVSKQLGWRRVGVGCGPEGRGRRWSM